MVVYQFTDCRELIKLILACEYYLIYITLFNLKIDVLCHGIDITQIRWTKECGYLIKTSTFNDPSVAIQENAYI